MGASERESWSREAVIYEVYVRSFADSNGDGIGDLAGVMSRLDYLADLGVDALWLTPFYRSPMADGGYDVVDHREVDPIFGTLDDFDKLLVEAHARDLKIIVDLVPNHTSIEHPWFQAALAAGPDSLERRRYHFAGGGESQRSAGGGESQRSARGGESQRSARGGESQRSARGGESQRSARGGESQRSAGGGESRHSVSGSDSPPNNWQSIFRGPAWTQVPDGEWYLHLFAPEQPDLNWDNPEVRNEYADVLRFWLDRGVDGIRIDVAHGLVKAAGLPDATRHGSALLEAGSTPYLDQDGVHEIYRNWRSILDTYAPERIAVGEAWLPDAARTARYVRPGELHQAFNFEFLLTPWSGPAYRRSIDDSLSRMGAVGAPTTWVLSNHDVTRQTTRLATGRGGTSGGAGSAEEASGAIDTERGLRRARAAILLLLALPGSVYLYQGEELGLPEVLDLPASVRQDPIFARTGGAELGRDGCRVPLPWSGTAPPYGFGAGPAWLPQPSEWGRLSVAAQHHDPTSTLSLYRRALRLRRELTLGRGDDVTWHSDPDADLLILSRRADIVCAINLGDAPAEVSIVDGSPLVASGELNGTMLPPDRSAWWKRR